MTAELSATGGMSEETQVLAAPPPPEDTQLPASSAPVSEAVACPFCGGATDPGRAFCATCGQPGTLLAPASTLHGAYAILEVLASSSTGAVYRAQDKRRKRQVAIKELLPPAGESAQERAALQSGFAREVRRIADLKHPLLPQVYESFSQDGRHYLVMGLISGRDLGGVLAERGRGFGETQVRGWSNSLLDLLSYLRARGFVHGEIMPAHLLLQTDGALTLIGYGLSWRLGLRPRAPLFDLAGEPPARQGGVLRARFRRPGTRRQLPTERDDLYGLGATLYALLTGRDASVLSESGGLPPVRDLAPRTSVGLAEVINRAASADPRQRFARVSALQAALGSGAPLAARRGGYGRVAAFGILVAAIAVIAGLALYVQHNIAPAASSTTPTPVGGAGMAPRTLPLSDTFLGTEAAWPVNGRTTYLRGGTLSLRAAGAAAGKITLGGYQTGAGGFTARAALRLAAGSPTASYGLVIADRGATPWENAALLVSADGRWALERYHGGHAPLLAGWSRSPAVRRGHNTPNELALAFTPGANGAAGAFAVIINGQQVAAGIPAWGPELGGKVGILAGPGATVAADALGVQASVAPVVAVEDHFLDNRLGWRPAASQDTSPVREGMLRLRPVAGQPFQVATAGRVYFGKAARTVTASLSFNLHAPSPAGQQGGIVFARPASGISGPTLAAVLGLDGRVALLALDGATVRTLVSAASGAHFRPDHGFNTLALTSTLGAGKVEALIQLNGKTLLRYVARMPGLVRGAGVVEIGNATLDGNVLRISGRGVSSRAV